MRKALLVLLLGMFFASPKGLRAGEAAKPEWQKRWVYVPSNLYVNENLPKLEALFKRAKAAGYNGVLFTDYKTFTWWNLDAAERWKANARKLRALCTDLGLELNLCVMPFGYASSLLFNDVNLANGMPVKDAPLLAQGGALVPQQTAELKNGSFEERQDHRALGFGFQDNIGAGSFIDTETVKHGAAALRFEDVGKVNPHGHGRINQKLKVKPWTQYRLRVWLKAERLTAGEVKLLVLAGKRTLQHQYVPYLADGELRRLHGARDFTCDWVEASVTFNSLDNEEVGVYLGQWGGKTGKLWFDDCRIDDAPTLNLLRRDSLPIRLAGEDGTLYEEGKDFERVEDPKLGRAKWPGTYDTRHEPPVIKLTADSRIKEGQKVLFSGYHATIVMQGQMNCSMSEPKVFELCKLELEKAIESVNPDGWFMSHDEIRCAGWEPAQLEKFKTSGELLAHNIRRCYEIANETGGGKPVYVWSDMYDPHHNAHEDFYLVNNTIAGSWEGLDPNVIVMKWGGGKIARPGLQHFAARGHKQMIAGYYDEDVRKNHEMWLEAARDVPGVIGAMYTTWADDYANLEKFAEVWWGGGK
ncbi:MAG: hypothetical protein M5U26_16355 [Planctomycetota bacterium]|nr:hypothetical protein [Planctomycetota bacterium]